MKLVSVGVLLLAFSILTDAFYYGSKNHRGSGVFRRKTRGGGGGQAEYDGRLDYDGQDDGGEEDFDVELVPFRQPDRRWDIEGSWLLTKKQSHSYRLCHVVHFPPPGEHLHCCQRTGDCQCPGKRMVVCDDRGGAN